MKESLKRVVVPALILLSCGYAVGYLSHKFKLPPYGALSTLKGWLGTGQEPEAGSDEPTLRALDRPAQPAPDGAPPNVVFIVLDTARADRMSYTGYHRDTTPHVDRVARDGVVYSGAHSVAPWTLPSHMSMFTGLPPGQHGATWAAYNEPEDMTMKQVLARKFSLDDPSRLLTVQLKELGYRTAGFSGNIWVSPRTGFDIGFDGFYLMAEERDTLRKSYDNLPAEIRTSWSVDKGDGGLELIRFKQHVLQEGGDLEQPFFLFFNFIDPHYPYSPPEAWRYAFTTDRELEKKMVGEFSLLGGDRPFDVALLRPYYDAEISYVDFVVGRLMTWLRKKGYYDDTLIVITSDHGEHLGEKGRFSHQLSIEQELLRIPLVVKYPGNEQAGRVVDNPLVSNIDVYETILSAARRGSKRRHMTISRDLRDMAAFDRNHLIAEYYYSTPYLRALERAVPGFPVEEHRIIRRVVFDRNGRHVFLEPGREPVDTDPARQAAACLLADYLLTIKSNVLRVTQEGIDEKTLERLRALGYVE